MIWLIFFGLVFFLNFLGLLWCYFRQSDKLTDLIYSLSFLSLSIALLLVNGDYNWVNLGVVTMVSLWSIRLGAYLFIRIHEMKQDKRFDEMRKKFVAIGGFWLLQTVSIYIIGLPVVVILAKEGLVFNSLSYVGLFTWVLGWVIESVSDYQKFKFRNNPKHQNDFVNIGLWKYLQHPNYLGEILCWLGLWMFTVPYLRGFEYLSIISPVWIIILLVFISGIPLLQKNAAKKYGHLSAYQDYQEKVAKLIPFIW